jgi:hypothetical protein
MPLLKRSPAPPQKNAEEPQSVIDAMAHAKEVKAEYKELVRAFRKRLYKVLGGSLACYRNFLKDKTAQVALFGQDNIVRLREKPALKETSRLLLYYLTDARSEPERNIAGKHACIVDFLYDQDVENVDAAEYIEKAGGIEQLLKKARKDRALRAADETMQSGDQGFDSREEFEETVTLTSKSESLELFDPEKDLAIRLRRETLAQVLGSEIPMNKSFNLECRKTGSVGRDGIRIVGRLVDPESM